MVSQLTQSSTIQTSLIREHIHHNTAIDFILFATGWAAKWGSDEYFSHYPTLSEEAAQYLSGLNLKGVGFDTISADKEHSKTLPNHRILLRKGLILIENLTGLDKLPARPFDFLCFPLKIQDADGSPVRAVAIDDCDTNLNSPRSHR